jgi:hypothetical protein
MLSDSDTERLAPEHSDSESTMGHTERAAARLGIVVPNASALAQAILSDLDVELGGVKWWVAADKREAILIADHGYQAAGAPLGLLLEARLHLSALERLWQIQEERWIAAARRERQLTVPESTSPLEDVLGLEESLHITGFFRCVAQVLDCVAAAAIVVLDLPAPVQRAAWPIGGPPIDRYLKTEVAGAAQESLDRIAAAVAGAGPQHWSEWAVAMRHLVVHRPRLMGFNQVYGSGAGLKLPGGDNAGNLRICHHLPRQPQRAWIEALSPNDPAVAYLEEHAGLTLHHLFRSTATVVDSVSAELAAAWNRRRDDRVDQAQWLAQWPFHKAPALLNFPGYAPGERPVEGDQVVLNTVDALRLQAAQLGDSRRAAIWGDGVL